MTISVRTFAKLIDHALLQPSLTSIEFDAGCDLAIRYDVATVCVKSADVQRAVIRMQSSGVGVCAVVGFPHANVEIEIMRLEAARALDQGATEIDMVVNLSRMLSDDWSYVREQVTTLNDETHRRGGLLKVIFETGLIRERERKVRLCAICRESKVDFVKTSTGFAYARNADGVMASVGATVEDVKLLSENAGGVCGVKASGGIRSLGDALAFVEAGATRLGTTSTEAILREVEAVAQAV